MSAAIRPAAAAATAATGRAKTILTDEGEIAIVRNSLAFVSWKDRKALLPSIKAIYRAETAELAEVRLSELEVGWGRRYPAIGQIWRRHWEQVIPFFAFPVGIRKMI